MAVIFQSDLSSQVSGKRGRLAREQKVGYVGDVVSGALTRVDVRALQCQDTVCTFYAHLLSER